MKRILIFSSALTLMLSCGDNEQSEEAAIHVSADKPSIAKEQLVSESEYTLLKPYIDDLRSGIVEFAPNTIGICEGQSKACDSYLGTEVLDLEPGKYMLRAEFQAPKLAPDDGWKITVSVDCEITKTSKNTTSKTSKSYSKEYAINHVSRTEYGYRLSPLYQITSPSSRGVEDCKWEIRGNNLKEPVVWSGRYTVPQKSND